MEEISSLAQYGDQLIEKLEETIYKYSKVNHCVLITGERGTGKTTIARRLHLLSPRAEREFVNLNCASLTGELLESELFGYEKGAFTGAMSPKAGLFEIANGGTLFLDEIGEIPVSLQAKLLKAVEEKKIRRVGGNSEREVDVRILAATSQDLEAMISRGTFRPDLFDRINVLSLETVPLRLQKKRLKEAFLLELKRQFLNCGRVDEITIDEDAIKIIQNHQWQGNFRELLNFATRISVECLHDASVTAEAVIRILGRNRPRSSKEGSHEIMRHGYERLPLSRQTIPEGTVVITFDPRNESLETLYIKTAASVINHLLLENGNRLRQAANTLGATHTTLSRILSRYEDHHGGLEKTVSLVKI